MAVVDVMRIADAVAGRIEEMREHADYVTVAIDGRCASGKTTLAAMLQQKMPCSVVRMDDFFLQPAQRTEQRLREPGGNVDYSRFLEEVLIPLKEHRPFSYCPYDCHTQSLTAPKEVQPQSVAIVEGSYSCHPELWRYYDLHIFLDVMPWAQSRRILERNGIFGLMQFREKWIPLEEKYFSALGIANRCELYFGNSL